VKLSFSVNPAALAALGAETAAGALPSIAGCVEAAQEVEPSTAARATAAKEMRARFFK
jgi:hypothetical protein